MSSILNFKLAQGDTMAEGLAITNTKSTAPPIADLATVEFLVKNKLTDADATAVLDRHTDVVAELVIDDANGWTITIKATAAETFAIPAGRYKCVCSTIDTSGNTVEAFRGAFVVRSRGSDPS